MIQQDFFKSATKMDSSSDMQITDSCNKFYCCLKKNLIERLTLIFGERSLLIFEKGFVSYFVFCNKIIWEWTITTLLIHFSLQKITFTTKVTLVGHYLRFLYRPIDQYRLERKQYKICLTVITSLSMYSAI